MDSSVMTSLIIPAFGAMSAAISTLFWLIIKNNKNTLEKVEKINKQSLERQESVYIETSKKLESCEDNHRQATERMICLTERVGKLEGEKASTEAVIERLIKEVRKVDI